MTMQFHLICGSTGAGKTSYAIGLAERLGGVRFSIDEWMKTLFEQDAPQPIDFQWTIERVNRCETQIGQTAIQCARLGLPAVLDLGFTRAHHRARFAALAAGAGFEAKLHVLDVDAETRWSRVEARNHAQGETFSIKITRPMFDFIENLWEPPTPAEMNALNGIRVA